MLSGIALINLGQTETRLAALQEALANDIRMGYMTTLENGLQEYKEYDALRKKLASRRLDYDSKLNRLHKAKKEKPELEQEMQASRIKYEDTEHDLIQKMAYIQEFEVTMTTTPCEERYLYKTLPSRTNTGTPY